jgi:hypothetical protein
LSASDDPHQFAPAGSDYHYLFVEYDDNVFAEFLEPIEFIDINDDVVTFGSIEPSQTESGSMITLKGCGWIPLDDIQVHFQTDTGELAVSELESKTIDEIQVKVPDNAVSGMIYVTAGNKTTTKQFLDLKTYSLKQPELPEITLNQNFTLEGKGLVETQSVILTDQRGNSFSATMGGASDNSLTVTIPGTLSPGVVTAYAERSDGKLSNEINLVIRPSLVTASPGETSFVDSIEITLSQPEDHDIYYHIDEAAYQIYTGPIELLASETPYEYISLFTYAHVEVNGQDYDSPEREYRYTPCLQNETLQNGVCIPSSTGAVTTCPASLEVAQASGDQSWSTTVLFHHDDKDNNGDYEDYLRCVYFENGDLEIQVAHVNFEMEGLRLRYYQSGMIWSEGYYVEGRRHGTYREYSPVTGNVISCIIYDMGSIDSYCPTG